MKRQKYSVPQMVREAVDTYPGGLCFSMPDGRPILVNRKMNELIFVVTGHTILNARNTWEEISNFISASGCRKLQTLWNGQRENSPCDQVSISFADGTIWRFKRDTLENRNQIYIQIEASDITELYNLSEELSDTNSRLSMMYQRQKKLLENIEQINRERERVSVKMKVHDEFGQCLIATRKAFHKGVLPEKADLLAREWQNAICSLSNIPLEQTPGESSSEIELMRVAGMIGCQIIFSGERPVRRRERLLLYAAVREALTNAVKHAKADRLQVEITHTEMGYHIELSDNGTVKPSSVREGSGLGALRQRLEREGAAMQVKCENGVTLLLDIPSVSD